MMILQVMFFGGLVGKLLKLLHLHSNDTEKARRVSVCESVGDPERLRDTFVHIILVCIRWKGCFVSVCVYHYQFCCLFLNKGL